MTQAPTARPPRAAGRRTPAGRTNRIAALGAAIACALCAPAALADAGAGPTLAELDAVLVTADHFDRDGRKLPTATTVLAAPEPGEVQVALEALRGRPGTFFQQTTPGQGNVLVRGLKGSEVLHLVDGFRLNAAFFRNAPNQYMGLVDPLNLEQVEVLRGPMSTVHGSDAMGGVVQLVTPSPQFHDDGARASGLASAYYNSADAGLHARAAVDVGGEGWALRAGTSRQDIGLRRAGGGDTLPDTAYTSHGNDLRAAWRAGEAGTLELLWQDFTQPSTPRFDALNPGFGQTLPESDEFAFAPQSRRFGLLRYRGDAPAWLADEMVLQAGRQTLVDGQRSRNRGSDLREFQRNTSRLDGASLQLRRQASDALELRYGLEAYRDRIEAQASRLDLGTGLESPVRGRFVDGSSMDTSGAYLVADWEASEAWRFNAGLRHSRFRTRIPATASTPEADVSASDLSGQAGLSRALDAAGEWRLVANVGRAFRAPNVFDLGALGPRPGNRFNLPNPDLAPETALSADLGLKLSRPGLDAEAFVFATRYRDKISSVLTGDTTPLGQAIVQSRNVTELELHGVETAVDWRIDEQWRLQASASWTRGEEQAEGDTYPADRIPPVYGRLELGWRPEGFVSLRAWTDFAGRQDRLSPRDATDPRINPDGTAGWATLNLGMDWQALPGLELRLEVRNLLDRRYREHGSGLDAPGRGIGVGFTWTGP